MIVHDNTKRTTHATAKPGNSGVVLVLEHDGLIPEHYTMSKTDATELAEDLLMAAGVKFKITLNA